MPNNYDNIDLGWSWDGDYQVGSDHDLGDTAADAIQSLIQEIMTIVKSESRDWELWPNMAGNADESIGRPNNKTTAAGLQDRLRAAIVSMGLVAEADLKVKVIPVHMNEVLVNIQVAALPSPYNSLSEIGFVVQFVFDFMEQGIFCLSKTPVLQRTS